MKRSGNFNPRSPHGERHTCAAIGDKPPKISTHAPRTGSDASRSAASFASIPFQPTLPARGATRRILMRTLFFWNFNPRSPHGERHSLEPHEKVSKNFNPRSPHGERQCYEIKARGRIFISTHAPRTGSDDFAAPHSRQGDISTHAPRTGSDQRKCGKCVCFCAISTHAPRTGSDALRRTVTPPEQ